MRPRPTTDHARGRRRTTALVAAAAGLVTVAATFGLAPSANAATVVQAELPSYVDWDTVQIPTVPGVRYVDGSNRRLTGTLDLPAVNQFGFREITIKAVADSSAYTLDLDSAGWDYASGNALVGRFDTLKDDELIDVTAEGCAYTFTNVQPYDVEYGYSAGGNEVAGVLRSGASFRATATGAFVYLAAQHPADASARGGISFDSFECAVGKGRAGARARVSGCTITFERVRGSQVDIWELFYRDGEGNRSLEGVTASRAAVDNAWATPVTFDFSRVGEQDLTVFWGEQTLVPGQVEPDDYFGSTTLCSSTAGVSTPAAPAQPYTSVSGSTVAVAWQPVTSTGGSPITGYVVKRTGPGGVKYAAVPADQTRLTLANLPRGAYSFQVYATNAAGNSAPSPARTAVVASRPGAPALPGAVVRGRNITVNWAPPRDNGGAAVTGYVVRMNNRYVAVPASTRALTFRNLPKGNHYVVVYAQNALGNSAASPVRKVTLR